MQCTKGKEVTSKHRISNVLEDLKLGPNESFWFLALLGNNVGYFIGKCVVPFIYFKSIQALGFQIHYLSFLASNKS